MTALAKDVDGRAAAQRAKSAARLLAVQALYQLDMTQSDVNAVLAEFLAHRMTGDLDGRAFDEVDQPLFRDLVHGVVRDQMRIDPLVAARLAKGWRLSRIDSILRSILRAGTFELLARPEVPAKVVINEYVEVARGFFEQEEVGVVNAVLDALARAERPVELS